MHDPMRVITADTQELGSYHDRGKKGRGQKLECIRSHSHAKNPSSSSLRLGAGNGAPGFSCVGSLTYPPSPKGFSDLSVDKIGVDEEVVLTGISVSRRDHPSEPIESRKALEAMFARCRCRCRCVEGQRNGRQQASSTPLQVMNYLPFDGTSKCRLDLVMDRPRWSLEKVCRQINVQGAASNASLSCR